MTVQVLLCHQSASSKLQVQQGVVKPPKCVTSTAPFSVSRQQVLSTQYVLLDSLLNFRADIEVLEINCAFRSLPSRDLGEEPVVEQLPAPIPFTIVHR